LKHLWYYIILIMLVNCGSDEKVNSLDSNSESNITQQQTGVTQLTFGSDTDSQNPVWISASNQLAFNIKNNQQTFEIWMMDLKNLTSQKLFGTAKSDAVIMPGGSWCSVNNRLCFSSDHLENDEIWSMKQDGTDLFQITNHSAKDWEPTWSSDGEWVTFQSDRSGNWDIYKIHANGSDLIQLSNDPAMDWQPNWSPDGNSIVFQSNRSGYWDVWVMDPNGQNVRNITDSKFEDTDPSWAPDSDFIVFSSDRTGRGDIYTISLDSPAVLRQMTQDPAYDGAPAWSPDRTSIAFESNRTGKLNLFMITIAK